MLVLDVLKEQDKSPQKKEYCSDLDNQDKHIICLRFSQKEPIKKQIVQFSYGERSQVGIKRHYQSKEVFRSQVNPDEQKKKGINDYYCPVVVQSISKYANYGQDKHKYPGIIITEYCRRTGNQVN